MLCLRKRNFKIAVTSTINFQLEYSIYYADKSTDFFLYLHGLPGVPFNELSYVPKKLASYGYNTVYFNYPGMWSKDGFFSAIDLYNGIFALIQDLKQQTNISSLNLFGESFGGLVAMNLLGNVNTPLPISKVVLRSPVLAIGPIMDFLPVTLQYLAQAGILNIQSLPQLLQEIKTLDPIQYYEKISSLTETKIWGVFGKNDDVLPAYKMLEVVGKYPSINVELWNDFPHNDIDDILYNKFFTRLQEFMKLD